LSIRKHNKDHSASLGELDDDAAATSVHPDFKSDDSLQFWTAHDESHFVDLTPFANGQEKRERAGLWGGPYSGRPELIREIAPVIRGLVDHLAPDTVVNYEMALRAWWRLFDDVETSSMARALPLTVKTTKDITEIHARRAIDGGMHNNSYRIFVRILNLVRRLAQQSSLNWPAVKSDTPKPRDLPPSEQMKEVRIELKHAWFGVLWRWERADELMAGQTPRDAEEERLAMNYRHYSEAVEEAGHPQPGREMLKNGMTTHAYEAVGYRMADMLKGSFPDSTDIRVALHCCMASTGWNASTLLNLRTDQAFLVVHPKDPSRYVLYGVKKRAAYADQTSEGLLKSQGSAGVILETLIKRTEPLRNQLRKDLKQAELLYAKAKRGTSSAALLNKLKKKIGRLKKAVVCPWLYVSAKSEAAIHYLDTRNYGSGLRESFLHDFITDANANRTDAKKLPYVVAGDFRHAFADYAYEVSGGLVLFVMKALGQKHLKTSLGYVNHVILNRRDERQYVTLQEVLWDELAQGGKVDATVLAKRAQDGAISVVERQRLQDYRNLRTSRIGVGCERPHAPPRHIAPAFEPDGKKNCPVQRCTLCENAVLLPESRDGLCMRQAELEHVMASISVAAFLESSFEEELENTKLALRRWPQEEVQENLALWRDRIASGEHKVVDLTQ